MRLTSLGCRSFCLFWLAPKLQAEALLCSTQTLVSPLLLPAQVLFAVGSSPFQAQVPFVSSPMRALTQTPSVTFLAASEFSTDALV